MSLYEAKRGAIRTCTRFRARRCRIILLRRGVLPIRPINEIPRPRFGFFGVIDERLDRDLVAAGVETAGVAADPVGPSSRSTQKPCPVPNIHYLGRKSVRRLPRYIAGWDAAMMPFALNDATRFISPTKTPEYLAAGKPVVSTPIVDVVHSWGHLDAVRIAGSPTDFIRKLRRRCRAPRGAVGSSRSIACWRKCHGTEPGRRWSN